MTTFFCGHPAAMLRDGYCWACECEANEAAEKQMKEAAELDALEALARAATPGKWRNEPDTGAGRVWVQRSGGWFGRGSWCEPLFRLRGPESYEQRAADAAYIAAVSPDVVLGLIERLRGGGAA